MDCVNYRCLIVGITMLVTGCASTSNEYWQNSMPRSLVQSVERVTREDMPPSCKGRHGCAIRFGYKTRIFILAGLPDKFDACVESHERRHADGWRHSSEITKYLDCGDGTYRYPNGNKAVPLKN